MNENRNMKGNWISIILAIIILGIIIFLHELGHFMTRHPRF